MAFAIERIPNTAILAVRGQGDGDLAESAAILDALEREASPGAAVLFDVRALTFIPTLDEARDIADRYGRAGARRGYRMAYLAMPGSAQYGITRMVEMLSVVHGVVAGAFADEAEAIEWLDVGGGSPEAV